MPQEVCIAPPILFMDVIAWQVKECILENAVPLKEGFITPCSHTTGSPKVFR